MWEWIKVLTFLWIMLKLPGVVSVSIQEGWQSKYYVEHFIILLEFYTAWGSWLRRWDGGTFTLFWVFYWTLMWLGITSFIYFGSFLHLCVYVCCLLRMCRAGCIFHFYLESERYLDFLTCPKRNWYFQSSLKCVINCISVIINLCRLSHERYSCISHMFCSF